MQKVTIPAAGVSLSTPAARISIGSAVAVLVFLVVLHVISPELDPSWRMVSEYALGEYPWVLSLMFFAWALSALALFFAIRSQINSPGGKIGLGLLIVAILGMGLAIIFDVSHPLHGLATLLGIPTFPVAALLISGSLGRIPAWRPYRGALMWLANLTWISLGLMLAMLFIGLGKTGGEFTPDVWIGWPNRLVIVAYCGWLLQAALSAIQLDRRTPPGR